MRGRGVGEGGDRNLSLRVREWGGGGKVQDQQGLAYSISCQYGSNILRRERGGRGWEEKDVGEGGGGGFRRQPKKKITNKEILLFASIRE